MFFDIVFSLTKKEIKTVEYKKLEELYDAFVKHKRFHEIEAQAERILQHPNLSEEGRKTGQWVYNIWFWNNFFETPKGSLFQTPKRYTIEVNGFRVELSSEDSPNFMDRDKYLSWLHQQINNQA